MCKISKHIDLTKMLFLFLTLTINFSYAQDKEKDAVRWRKDLLYAFDGLQKDKILEPLKTLNVILKEANEAKNDSTIIMSYNVMGLLFTQIENYDVSLDYYQKALLLAKKIDKKDKIAVTLSNMAQSYLYKKDFQNLDRTLQEAKKYDDFCDAYYPFHNYEYEIIKLYEQKKYIDLHLLCEKSLEELLAHKSTKGKQYIEPLLMNRFKIIFNLYNAFGLISAKKFEEGYQKLILVEKADIKKTLWDKSQLYELIEGLYFYKYKYFNDYKKDEKQASINLLQSLKYNNIALEKVRSKAAKNGKYVYYVIQNERIIKENKTVREKDKKIKDYLYYMLGMSILVGFTLLVLIAITVHKNRKIKAINKSLEDASDELNKKNKTLLFNDFVRKNFFSIISHELKNPLLEIRNNLAFVKKDGYNENLYETLSVNSNNLITIIDNAAVYSKRNYDDIFEISKVFLSVTDLAKSAFEYLSYFAKEKNVSLKFDSKLIEDGLEIFTDKDIIKQVLVNLLTNAIKYASNCDVILAVESEIIDKNLALFKFKIIDFGKGIEADKMPYIFKAFKRPDVFDEEVSGVGLGLYTSQILLEKLGSKCFINSEPNKNTIVFFELETQYKL